MFTVWYKIKDEQEVEMTNVTYCGIHPDYSVPVYFIRDSEGTQIEIPVMALSYLKFSKGRYEECVKGI